MMYRHDERLKLPDGLRARLGLNDTEMVEAGLIDMRRAGAVAVRRNPIELRSNDDGTRTLVGYALTWDVPYSVAGGPPWGWTETIVAGALDKSMEELRTKVQAYDEPVDVRFLANHEGLALGRTRGLPIDTMSLVTDKIGLRVEANIDEAGNPFAAALASAVGRGDVDQMSWAFMAMRQEWNADYTERFVTEARIFDVSAVTYPANPATIIAARAAAAEPVVTQRSGLPLGLALAQAAALE
jgi:HK97 family phage prohead protease